ncbi:MAG: hypothetical protein R3F49_25375 [Planctomycetota bacterium]
MNPFLIRALLLAFVANTAISLGQRAEVEDVEKRAFGAGRHVQLLANGVGGPIFATASNVITGNYPNFMSQRARVEVIYDGMEAQRVQMDVPFALLQEPTWSTLPTWRFIDGEKASLLGCVDRKSGRFVLFSFPDGRELLRCERIESIEDSSTERDRALVLLRKKDGLVVVSTEGRKHASTSVMKSPDDLNYISACFAPQSRYEHPRAIALVSADNYSTTLLELDIDSDAAGWYTTPLKAPTSGQARIDATGVGAQVFVVVSDPLWKDNVGRVAMMRIGGEPCLFFDSGPALSKRNYPCNYGQSIGFVGDVDGDKVPDICVAWPFAPSSGVDIVSGRTGTEFSSWRSPPFQSAGHWLSTDCGIGVILVGGTVNRAFPENITESGRVWLLSAPSLKLVAEWEFPGAPEYAKK